MSTGIRRITEKQAAAILQRMREDGVDVEPTMDMADYGDERALRLGQSRQRKADAYKLVRHIARKRSMTMPDGTVIEEKIGAFTAPVLE